MTGGEEILSLVHKHLEHLEAFKQMLLLANCFPRQPPAYVGGGRRGGSSFINIASIDTNSQVEAENAPAPAAFSSPAPPFLLVCFNPS